MEPPPPSEKEMVELVERKMEEEHAGWLPGLRWNPTSFRHLRKAEENIMQFVGVKPRARYVDIGPVVGRHNDKLWTLSFNETAPGTPLVLVHGFASGVALWCLNYDTLAAERPVHAFDNIGFGRSSRPDFSKDPEKAEQQFVDVIEAWREKMGLEKMILLGHSLGGFLSCAYALRHPERLEHLILADPWGFAEPATNQAHRPQIPLWIRGVIVVTRFTNPLSILRLGGPWGSTMIEKARPDLLKKFSSLVSSPPDHNYMASYIYHCNAQTPSGEAAFHTLSNDLGWSRNPMVRRVRLVDPDVPMTCIYGSRSWIDDCGQKIRAERPNSFVDVETILGASHHVYADQPANFNELVSNACQFTRSRLRTESEDGVEDAPGFFLRTGEDAEEEDSSAALRDAPPRPAEMAS